MREVIIFKDINLDAVSFSSDGRSINFSFVDMLKGQHVGNVKCVNAYAFNFHNTFEEDGDGLACYIGSVGYTKLDSDAIEHRLSRMGFGFLGNGIQAYQPKCTDPYELSIAGGEIDIKVVCERVERC